MLNISPFLFISALSMTFFLSIFFFETSILLSFSLSTQMFFAVDLSFLIDKESFLFFASVSWISAGVFKFSRSYMSLEPFKSRFFYILLSFVISMMILILSVNIFSLLIGWDGLGVTSFLLVVFFQNKNSLNAGLLTVLTNRLGDLILILSTALLVTLSYWNIFLFDAAFDSLSTFIPFLIIIAAFTKSAQIPFSSWLPAAMAAPTPVSALVHSSTLVTAGIFMLIRFKATLDFFGISPIVLLMGCLTMIMAGMNGLLEMDFKKMVALSTLSQLGLLMASIGLGAFSAAFFHLLTHAYFKALLFLATGSSIHSASDYQDLRLISLPPSKSPWTFCIILICNLSLMGLPFLAGFYSKDLILEMSFSHASSFTILHLFILGTALTVCYATRFLILSSSNALKKSLLFSHADKDFLMMASFDRLLLLAVTGGSVLNWLYLKWAPSLLLSHEMKNMVFLMIISLLIGICFYPSFFFSGSSFLTVKHKLGAMWGLAIIAPSIMKLNSFFLTKFLFFHIENFIISQSLFFATSKPFSIASVNLNFSRSLSFFMLVFLSSLILLWF